MQFKATIKNFLKYTDLLNKFLKILNNRFKGTVMQTSRKHPRIGVKSPTHPFPSVLAQIVKNDIKKILTLIAFSELFFDDVKVEILLISWHLLMVFWMRLPVRQPIFIATPIFMKIKGVEVVHMSCKFYLHLTCNSRVFIFGKFS